MQQKICDYHLDAFGDWVAELHCGHFQHVRHNPPWIMREWVTTKAGRAQQIGKKLSCKKCEQNLPPDTKPSV